DGGAQRLRQRLDEPEPLGRADRDAAADDDAGGGEIGRVAVGALAGEALPDGRSEGRQRLDGHGLLSGGGRREGGGAQGEDVALLRVGERFERVAGIAGPGET